MQKIKLIQKVGKLSKPSGLKLMLCPLELGGKSQTVAWVSRDSALPEEIAIGGDFSKLIPEGLTLQNKPSNLGQKEAGLKFLVAQWPHIIGRTSAVGIPIAGMGNASNQVLVLEASPEGTEIKTQHLLEWAGRLKAADSKTVFNIDKLKDVINVAQSIDMHAQLAHPEGEVSVDIVGLEIT